MSDAQARREPEAVLQVSGITRSYGGVRALRGADLEVRRGEVVALLGLNGAGKSTLIRILSGMEQPGAGDIRLDGQEYAPTHPQVALQSGLAVVHQQRTLVPHLSVAENILLGEEPTRGGLISGRRMHREVAELSATYGLPLDVEQSVDSLGAGQQQMVDILRALRSSAKVLLLDEPTAALTMSEREALFDVISRLRDDGLGIMFVSHQLDEVFTICDRVIVLRDGLVVSEQPADAQHRDVVVREMIGEMADEGPAADTTERPDPGPVVLEVNGVGLPIAVREGEVVGVAGVAGSGCTDLLEYAVGLRKHPDRTRTLHGEPTSFRSPAAGVRHNCVLLPEKRLVNGVWDRLGVRENVSVVRLDDVSSAGMVSRSRERQWVRRVIEPLQVRTESIDTKVRHLSGGNQQKVVFARLTAQVSQLRGSLFCLDEPTEGVDIRTKPEMYHQIRHLAAERAAVLMASSDLDELLEVCDRVVVMREGAVTAEFQDISHRADVRRRILAAMLSDDPAEVPEGADRAITTAGRTLDS